MKIKHIVWLFWIIAMSSIVMIGYERGSWLWFSVLLSSAMTWVAILSANGKKSR